MPAIFISHSSKDGQVSGDIKAALTRLGFEHAFLDFDKETGLDIGANWEKRLYEELTRCHAVVLVLTPAWLASKWCFAELTQARALGKVILPVLCERVEGRLVLPDIQAVDLVDWNAGGLERLERRLRAISDELARGFALDPTRPPYPGINAFQKEDAAIYFGRDEESRAVLERLDARRTQGGARFVIIIGASGSGKSSLLKASVLPLLARRRAQWVILPDIRPEKAPMEALAKALAQHVGKPEGWRNWHEKLNGPDGATTLERLMQDARIGEARGATVLLPVDQFEECFTTTPATERAAFLGLLQAAFVRDLPFMVIATGRSDVLEGLIESSELVGHYETFPLTAMPLERYPRLIEGPAAVAGITVEKGLSERIGRDVESKEALPLLAHTLALLHQRGVEDRKLSLADYEALGDSARGLNPIQNSIRLAAEEAIKRLNPSERELDALRDAFVPHLVRVRLDDGKRVRQGARRSELPAESLRLIGALTEARLLTTRSSDAEREPLVEVTHEALFKAWPALDQWLTEQQAFLTDLERIRAAHENYAKAPEEQKSGELLYGLLLSRARDWLLKYPQRFISREMEPLRAYIAASAEVADAERARQQRTRKRQLQSAIAAAIGGIVIAAVAGWQYREANTARRAAEKSEEFAKSALSEANLAERAAKREKQAADQQRERAEQQTRLADAQRKIAEEQRNQALITQSRFLVDRANDVFKDGDYGTAVALALEALPDESRSIRRPHVASAESMLYRAVMALREQKTLPIEIAADSRFIHRALISPDGRRVLAVASQRDAHLFDAETGAEIKPIADDNNEFSDAAFTADSQHLIVQSRDSRLRVFDATDGESMRELPADLPEMAQVSGFRLMSDPRHVIATSPDGAARLWDVVQGKQLRTLPDGAHGGATLSPDGNRFAATTADAVRVWALDADAPPLVIDQVEEPRAFFFPDSTHVLVTSRDGRVRVWNIEQRKVVALVFEEQPISEVKFLPNGTGMILSWLDKIFAFDIAELLSADPTKPAAVTWEGRHSDTSEGSDPIHALAFSPDSRFLVSASRDGTARLWRLATGRDETVLRRHSAPIYAAGFSPDGKRLVTVGGDKTIRIWNGTPGGTVLEVVGHVARPSEAVFSPDGRRIVGRSAVGTAVWDLATGAQTASLPMSGQVKSAVFLDEKRVATHSGALHIWDTASGTTSVIGGNNAALNFVAASPDRRRIALYGALHLWNAEHDSAPAPVDARLGLMSSATFSPDGQQLAVTSTAGLHLIDAVSRKEIKALEASDPTLESAAYSRDGRTLFVGSRRGMLQALDTVTLNAQSAWSVGDTAIIDLKVSPDGRRILAVTHNGTRVYDIATREEVAVLDMPSAITQAAFSPDGRFIVTNSDYLRIWPAFPTTQVLIDYARSMMPRPLTAQQRKDFFLEASTTAVPPTR